MPYSSTRCSREDRQLSKAAYISTLALLTGILNGCATKPVSAPLPSYNPKGYGSSQPSPKAAYNRPYKIKGHTYYPLASAVGYREYGIASWYGSESGNRTAMGARFRPQGISAAHKTLPLPTKVRVTNLQNGKSVVVVVNDRGPFKTGRLIDLSQGAARKIGIHGLARVKVEYYDETQASAASTIRY
jgi:rare lipoprotein A